MNLRATLLAVCLSAIPVSGIGIAAESESGANDPFAQAIALYRAGDPSAAAAMFRRLADAGDAEAQYNLALLYHQGEGVPLHRAEALYWAWRSRLSGLGQARALIARLQPTTEPKLRDQIADRLLTDLAPAIAQDDGRAMLGASIVQLELSSKPDRQAAYVLQSLAAAMATPGAARERDATERGMTAAERAKAMDAALSAFRDRCAEQPERQGCAAVE